MRSRARVLSIRAPTRRPLEPEQSHIGAPTDHVELTSMLAPEPNVSDFTLLAIDLRSVLRRVALPAVGAAFAVAAVFVLGGHIHTIADALRRIVGLSA